MRVSSTFSRSGSDLSGVGDGSIDAMWSFDVFVHVSPRDQAAYLQEIARGWRPVAQRLCTTPTGATVVSCHPATVGAHRCRAAYSQRWQPSEDCKSSVSWTRGTRWTL